MAKARQVEAVEEDVGEDQDTEMDVMLEAMGLTDDEDEGSREPAREARLDTPGPSAAPGPAPAPPAQQDTRTQDPQALAERIQHYEQAVVPHFQREQGRLGREIEQLRQTQVGLQQYAEQITQYGLRPDDAIVGLQMAAAFKKSPAEYIRNLIQVARSNNVDLSALNVPNQGMDAQVLTSVLDARLKPIMDRFQAQEQQAQLENQAQSQVQQFYTQYPDAPFHQNEIAVLMNQMGLSAERAYWELKTWAMQHGLDWRQNLTQQWTARGQQPPPPTTHFPANRRAPTYNQPITEQRSDQFDVNLNWKDVVKQAVAELNGV